MDYIFCGKVNATPVPNPSPETEVLLSYSQTVTVTALGNHSDNTSFVLSARDDLISCRSDFLWGEEGDEVNRLALAILSLALGEGAAVRLHRSFAYDFLVKQPMDAPWVVSSEQIVRWAASYGHEGGYIPSGLGVDDMNEVMAAA